MDSCHQTTEGGKNNKQDEKLLQNEEIDLPKEDGNTNFALLQSVDPHNCGSNMKPDEQSATSVESVSENVNAASKKVEEISTEASGEDYKDSFDQVPPLKVPTFVGIQAIEDDTETLMESIICATPVNAITSKVPLSRTKTLSSATACTSVISIHVDTVTCRASPPQSQFGSDENMCLDPNSPRTLVKDDCLRDKVPVSNFNTASSFSEVPLCLIRTENDLCQSVNLNRADDNHLDAVEQFRSDDVHESADDNDLVCDKSDSVLPKMEDTVQLSGSNMGDLCSQMVRTDGCQLDEVTRSTSVYSTQDTKSGAEGRIIVYDDGPDVTVEAGCGHRTTSAPGDSNVYDLPLVEVPAHEDNFSSILRKLSTIPESAEARVKVDGPLKGDNAFRHEDKRRLSGRKLKRFLPLCKKTTEVALLVEEHLKDVFVPFESVKTQLVRQSRDILLCHYQGQFHSFREEFLLPVASLLKILKSKYSERVCVCSQQNQYQLTDDSFVCENCLGWPLCFNRRLVVHLGELDEALLKSGDFYFCIKGINVSFAGTFQPTTNPSTVSFHSNFCSYCINPTAVCSQESCHSLPLPEKDSCTCILPTPVCRDKSLDIQTGNPGCNSAESSGTNSPVCLSIRYKPKSQQVCAETVFERKIDEHELGTLFTPMAWRDSPGSDVMISDDQLTSVLQHLLLSVERGIERLEWSGVTTKLWPSLSGQPNSLPPRCCHGVAASTKDSSVQTNPEEELTNRSADGMMMASHDNRKSDGTSNGESSFCVIQKDDENPSKCIEGLLNEITNCFSTSTENDGGRIGKPLDNDDDMVLRLTQRSLDTAEDDQDDGYYEHVLTQPKTLNQVDADLLHSEMVVLPGCRSVSGQSVIVISRSAIKNHPTPSACQLAQLFLYFQTIPKKEVVSQGFLILVDSAEVSEEFWNVLDEAFYLLEGNGPNAIGQVLVLCDGSLDMSSFFATSKVQCDVANSKEQLQSFIRKDQLLVKFGGTYVYDHQEWISFRKFLEPFIHGCRLSGRNLVSLLEELRGSRLPPSSALTLQMIEQQKKAFKMTFQDEQLRHLEEEGDTILQELESYRTKSPQNADYSENLDRTGVLYEELRKAMSKLSNLADKRLLRLEQCLQMRTFQEESSQVLSWLSRKGTESLEKHELVADTLSAIKEQEEEFEKFYFLAMRQIERGNDLLEEVSMFVHEPSLPKIKEESQPASDEDSGVQELAASLKQHLGSFSDKLEGTRERIEDTAKCYQLMDKSYEWALEAMRFVSQMGVSNTGSPGNIAQQIRCLQEYLDDHVPVSDDTFQEIMDLSEKLNSEKLTEQCKVAKMRCQETIDLIQARLKTLHKVKQQMEVDSFRSPLWDSDDSVPTPRTTRSNSQPCALWTPSSSSTPYSLCLGHHRRRSDTSALSSIPQSYGTPVGSYTSFPSSYYPTAKETHLLDSFIQEKEEQILHRGLITEDLTCQGPVTSISRGLLDSRISHREGPPSVISASSSSSSSSSNSSSSNSGGNKTATSVLRSSGRGTYTSNSSGGMNVRWSKRHTKRSQAWQLRDEALEKIKNEVREQNDLLRNERLHSTIDDSSDSLHSSETDYSPSSENSCKSRLDSVKGPVPVNTHLLTPTSPSDAPDIAGGGSGCDVVNDAEAKSRKTLMLIMKEMIQTERDYVKSLEYIIENYIPELLREDIPQALRGQRNVIFGNIEKIFEFHSQYFLSELEQYENAPFFAGQCFLKYEPQFYLYALYNKNKPKCDALMIEYGNAFFRTKQLELGDKMDLASYLLKPVQRMGKYALLLKQLLKECPEREPEHQDLKASEEMVRFQLRHGNDLLAMDALRDCDVNVKEQGRLLRQDEFLVWQGRCRKSLRHVFLFEDLILFSKARRDPQRKGYEMYQYKHSIKTTDMGLTEQIGDSPSKFEIWFRKRKLNDTYVLQAPTPEVKAAWVHELSKLLWKQALRNREMRLAEMSSMGIGNKPCLDIKPSEDQINDRSISIHQLARAPRFRNSFGMPSYEQKMSKRPHSIVSVSSSSSSGSSQSSFTFYGTLNLGFEPGDSPRPLHRSLTQQSQCSTESGFCTDASTAGDSLVDSEHPRHKKAERSDSLLSSDSLSTSTTPSEFNCSPAEEHIIEESITTSM